LEHLISQLQQISAQIFHHNPQVEISNLPVYNENPVVPQIFQQHLSSTQSSNKPKEDLQVQALAVVEEIIPVDQVHPHP